ncbi:AP-4 complex accessory subunit tepsin-like [Dysidea avara]|uniref:AP-4 complex accessory subunit tepsin-like n=1 Tax=Dysidea avara TaxID=196820 RepID=UPI00331828DE
MFGGPSLKSKIVNFRLMPSLIAATLASEKPTDGYLVNDIIKMSFESQQSRIFLQEYLMNQLVSTRNVYVKTKVLKLFTELVKNGHPEFRQNLLKQTVPLNDASKLRCTDPNLAGDVGRIRDLAKKLLDMLYDESITTTPPTALSSMSSRSFPESRPSSSDSKSDSKYEGFGNTTNEPLKAGGKSFLVGGLFGRRQQQQKPVLYDAEYASMTPISQNTEENNVIRIASSSRVDYTQGPVQSGEGHVRGMAGGGWGDDKKLVEHVEDRRFQPAGEEQQPLTDSSSEEEQRLVDTITAPGGVRAAPGREQLDHFIKKCKSLDVLVITDLMRDKLRSQNNQVVLRALFVLEAMLRSDIPSVESCLDLTLDELNTLCQSPQASIKSKATKLLKQLGATTTTPTESVVTMTTPSSRMTASSGGTTGNILDLDTPPVANGSTSTEQATVSMFEGLSVTDSSNTVPMATNNTDFTSLFGNMSINKPQPSDQTTEVAGEDDGLIDLGEQDDMFDPLVRTSSTSSRTGSLRRSGSTSSQSAFSFLKQSGKGEDLTASSDLFGAQPTAAMQQQQQQQPVGLATQMMQQPMMMGTNMMPSYNMPPSSTYQQQPHLPVSTAYQQPHLPYATAHMQGTGIQMPLLGNSARPVQLAAQTSVEDSSDSFSFLEKKTSKSGAFDFVQDEMKARMNT